MTGWRREEGFTLLEVVVSLSILAAIAAFLAVAFRLTDRSISRGESEASGMARQRAVTEILERSIRSAEPLPVEGKDRERTPYFLGESGKLRFLSASAPSSLSGGGSRLLCISGDDPQGETRGLVISEVSPMREAGVENWEGTENPRVLIPGATEVAFRYGSGPDDEGKWEWSETWDAREKKALPAAVRVEYVFPAEDGPRRTSFVVAIPAGGA